MNADLRLVRELQDVDNRIRELSQEINRLPRYIADIERQLEAHQKKLEADQAALAENKKAHRLLESDIAVQQQKLFRLREQMNEAKTNEQYRAFQHEIAYLEDEIRKAEDKILDKMVEAETLSHNVRIAEEALKKEKEKVQQEVSEARSRVAKDEEERSAVKAERQKIAEQLSPEVLRLYERIRKLRGGVAVARANAERCLACNVVLRPQFSQILRRNEQVLTCESCGLILYYEPPSEVRNVAG